MAKSAETVARKGPFRWARVIDDGVFAVERAIVALALMVVTLVVFIDVVHRRISAPESKIGRTLGELSGRAGDPAALAWIERTIAPWVTAGLSIVVIAFGFWTARRLARIRAGKPPAAEHFGKELLIAVAVALGVVAAGWGAAILFELLPSSVMFALLFGISTAVYIGLNAWRREEGWARRAILTGLVGAAMVWFALRHVPIGYTWSKKVSLTLLLWVGMLSISICVHEGKHIALSGLGKLAPEGARRYVRALGSVVAAAFCALMTYIALYSLFMPIASDDPERIELVRLFGTRYVYDYGAQLAYGGTLEGTDIPSWVGIVAAPIGFGIASLRFLGTAISTALGGTYGEPAPDDELEEARRQAEEKSAQEGG